MDGLKRQQCAVCKSRHDLQRCGGCKVFYYCSPADQIAHRSAHKKLCNAIKQTREALAREEAELVNDVHDYFNTVIGCFWDHPATHDYMKARFAAACALLGGDTRLAAETALGHFQKMLRLDRRDELRVRDMMPALMLRLGQEQECYDFLKWWANDNTAFDLGDDLMPFLNIRKANVFEPTEKLRLDRLSLSQLASLTLVKMRLGLDFEYIESEILEPRDVWSRPQTREYTDSDSESDNDDPLARRLGQLALNRFRQENRYPDVAQAVDLGQLMKSQYRRLCRVVNDRNPYFWEVLGDQEPPSQPQTPQASYGCGTVEEAELAVCRVKAAWDESEDALPLMNSETAELVRVYRGPSVATGTGTGHASPAISLQTENRRGTGRHFSTKFKPSAPTSTPADLFPAVSVGNSGNRRFLSQNKEKVLVYADGACPNNGQEQARGGWAVVFGPPDGHEMNTPHIASGRLEQRGPFGDKFTATSNRAELRAAIAALRVRDWKMEGFSSVVIATDSSYVVDGATDWVRAWTRNEWKTTNGDAVKNKDLWELLLGEFEKCHDCGLGVELWHIPRELNGDADAAAKKAATSDIPGLKLGSGRGPRVLALCLEAEGMFDAVWAKYVSDISSKASLERATTEEAAFAVLDELVPPSIILVTDAALSHRRRVWERVIDHVRAGATVVVAGLFTSLTSPGELRRFFSKVGLPWQMAEYSRETVDLRPGAVGNSRLASRLPVAYSQKAVFLKGVDAASIWYAPSDDPAMAAVAFTKVGNGKLGYIGDVNGEGPSAMVALAMCGLLG